MSTNVKFNYSDISAAHGEIKGVIETIRTDLETINSEYESVVQVSDGAIFGALGAQMLLNWDNVSSSFPKFMENFDSWAAVVAKSYGNYDATEEQIKGFRDANKYGYSQTLTQRGMAAAAAAAGTATGALYSEHEFEDRKSKGLSDVNMYNSYDDYVKANGGVTATDALAEIKGNGTDSANTFASHSPIDDSPVAGYDSANLPSRNYTQPDGTDFTELGRSTGTSEVTGSRSLVQSYTEEEDFERTAAVVAEGSDEAVNGGDAGESDSQTGTSTTETPGNGGTDSESKSSEGVTPKPGGTPDTTPEVHETQQEPPAKGGDPGVEPQEPAEPERPLDAKPGDPKPEKPEKPEKPAEPPKE